MNDIVLWYALSTLVSIAFAPLILTLFRHLGDRGAFLTRPLSALLLVWPAWFLAGIGPGVVPFSALTLWITLIAGGLLGWGVGLRSRALDRDAIRHLLIAEAGFAIAFAGFVLFHGYGPTLSDQEKLSDLMMLSSTMRAEQMPPADAWLSGYTINYYYIGYVIWAAFAKLAGTTPAVAFNLALASIFAMTVVAAAGLAGNVLDRWFPMRVARTGGLIAAILVVFAGHPWAIGRILTDWRRYWNTEFFDFNWPATRIVDRDTDLPAISEFPAFSFILADLHPHLLALPYAITALGCAWMLATLPSAPEGRSVLQVHWPRLLLAGGVAGGLYAMNSWDFPTYFIIVAAGFLAGARAERGSLRLAGLALLAVSAILTWLPFHLAFEAPTRPAQTGLASAVDGLPLIGGILASVAAVTGERTPLGDFVSIFGIFYAIALGLIGLEFWRRRERDHDRAIARIAMAGAGIMLLGGLLVPVPLLAVCGLPIVLILLLWERDASVSPANVALALFAAGFGLVLIPEFVFLLDIFGARFNTVFKVYYQAWLLMALASAIGLVVLWSAVGRRRIARFAFPLGAALLVLSTLTYPVIAGKQWLDWRSPDREWVGMDGLAFLEEDPGFPGEYAGIAWLLENAREDDVMLAAGGCEWSNTVSRTASASGVPSLLGWPGGHEGVWHLGDPAITTQFAERIAAITALGTEIDPTTIERYGVTLIYLGQAELHGGGPDPGPTCAPGPFPGASDPDYPGPGWTQVFREGDVRIFRKDGS